MQILSHLLLLTWTYSLDKMIWVLVICQCLQIADLIYLVRCLIPSQLKLGAVNTVITNLSSTAMQELYQNGASNPELKLTLYPNKDHGQMKAGVTSGKWWKFVSQQDLDENWGLQSRQSGRRLSQQFNSIYHQEAHSNFQLQRLHKVDELTQDLHKRGQDCSKTLWDDVQAPRL